MLTRVTFFLLLLISPTLASSDKLVVHEWGTFTSLQDENGRSIGGLNSNDEPLPPFVHRLPNVGIADDVFIKSPRARLHPDVTMRLETPVVYFYPPDAKPMTLDVSATFKGGLLSEYYPKAIATSDTPPRRLTAKTVGTLKWKSALIGEDAKIPATTDRIWLAPRAVQATPVTVNGQGEKYLFYRGVGHVEAPIKVVRSSAGIQLYDNRPADMWDAPMTVRATWLAEFRPDGACAFRVIDAQPALPEANIVARDASFADADFAKENTARLRAAMKQALIADGLFDDEADAMLETWKNSYFKTGGQRLFFVVPRQWTDRVLPLTISQPCELTRVMIGRIELVSPKQRELLTRMGDEKQRITAVTADRYHQQLGRFGDALLLDELRRHPNKLLSIFANVHGIIQVALPQPVHATTRPLVLQRGVN
ncbi:MAG: hypothetical protein ABIP55_04930 [Tepidisphaeraceae bacterium]